MMASPKIPLSSISKTKMASTHTTLETSTETSPSTISPSTLTSRSKTSVTFKTSTYKAKKEKTSRQEGDDARNVVMTWNSLHDSVRAKRMWRKAGTVGPELAMHEDGPESSPKDSGETKPPRKSIVSGIKRTPDQTKMKLEVLKLWDSAQNLMKKESKMTEDDIERLRRIIQEAVDLSGRIRLLVREKDTYTDEDVLSHAKDINNLQLFLHTVIETWSKVDEHLKEKHANRILADMMELATDVCSVFGEVMAIFLQRFGLNTEPLLRPIHGLFYSISIHCRYHCPDLAEDDINSLKSLYNSFLTALVGLCKSTKVLLKRLKFDQEAIANRRRMVQTNISTVIETMRNMVKDGRVCNAPEYVDTIERIGSLCTDIFFVIGKTSGVAELLELGEGVTAIEPAEVLGEVAHSDVQRCPIEQRPVILKGLQIEEGGSFISDVFVQTGAMFNPSQKVTLRMPYSGAPFPPGAIVKIKLKIGEEWYDTPGSIVGRSLENQQALPDGVAKVKIRSESPKKAASAIAKPVTEEMIEFQTKFVQAFVAIVEYLTQIRDLTPAGFLYICPDDDRVRLHFPEGCVSQTTQLAFKLIQINRSRMFDYKEQCPNLCKNIVAVSDCLKVDHDDDVVFLQPVMVHLPIQNDIDDNESEIVIFRSRDDGEVELIPKRTAMTCPSALNCYTFQIQNFSGIAIGKVKKKHLRKNRSAVVGEYELYMESAYICNILTFLDKGLLHVGMVKLFVEVVERRFLKKALRRRSKEGLFEVPGSRSPNIHLCNEDIVCIETDGNIQRMREIPMENYFIVFLSSARDNFRSFPVEQRTDPDGRTYGLLNFYKDNDENEVFLHCAHIDANKYLLNIIDKKQTGHVIQASGGMTPRSLGGSWISRPATRSARESRAFRAVFDEVPVLSHQSLLSLATYLRADTIQNVSYELGIPYEDVIEEKMSGKPAVIINFNLLWKWRGHKPKKDMVMILTRAFRICGYGTIAANIERALGEKRALTKDDFI